MSLYKQGEIYYAYVKHKGKRVRRSTGSSNKEAAQRFHDELKASLWNETATSTGEKTWLDACTHWLTAATRSDTDRYNLAFLNDTYYDRPLDQCTAESFETELASKSPATFNRYISVINAILKIANDRGWVENKVTIKKRSEDVVGFRFLTLEEWQRLLSELPEHLKAPARFSIATGLRQKNCLQLQWRRVDLSRRMMWVEPQDTKSKKPIGIPLSDDAVSILREQIGKHKEWVFPFKGKGRAEGGPIVKMKTAWHAALERSGLGYYERWETPDRKQHKKWVGDVTWHTFRHTFASWHIMSGTPREVLKELGGWSDMRMLERYAHLDPGHVARFANNMKPWSQTMAQTMAQV